MVSHTEVLSFRTKAKIEIVDITSYVEAAVGRSGISDGICLIHLPHATAAIVANENDAGLIRDLIRKLKEEFVREGWEHD
ncbi:MAG: YjbQ family protein, partial [Candidatus Korarchaeum sp.]